MLNQLEMLRIFCIAAECHSFKDAATRLGTSAQSVTRAIQALEARVGEPLFYRNTRNMHITDFGEQFAQEARASVAALDALLLPNHPVNDNEMAGVVRLTAPTTIGRRFLPPILSRISAKFPNMSFELKLSDSLTDVIKEQIDIGVRVGFLRDSSFVARATAKMRFFIVATPALIARLGTPQSIEALLAMPSVALRNQADGKCWPWYFHDSQQYKHLHPAFITDDAETELAIALQGGGFAQIADCLAAPYLASGELVSVLTDVVPAPWDIYVYRPQRGPVPARIRLVFDEIVNAFQTSNLHNDFLIKG